jgi:small conductance mechanosensitive channel
MDWLNLNTLIDAALGQSEYQLLNALLPMGTKVLGAAIVLVVGWIFAAWFSRTIDKFLEQRTLIDATIEKVLIQVIRFAILTVTVLMALQMFGVQTATILALLSGVALAIGLAVQGTLSNVAAGVMLLVLRPLKVGEWVVAAGNSGSVSRVGLFRTDLVTLANVLVSVPNTAIFEGSIQNYTRLGRRRMIAVIGVAYDTDLDKAMDVLRGVISANKAWEEMPEPYVYVSNLGDFSVDLTVWAWADGANYWEAQAAFRLEAKKALDEAGIEIPFPHQVEIKKAE